MGCRSAWVPTFTNTLGSLLGASAICVIVDSIGRLGADDFRRAFRQNVMFLVLAAYAVVLVASDIYTLDPVGSMAELASRGKAFLRSPWIGDIGLAKAAGPALSFGVLAFLSAEWAMNSFPWARGPSTYLFLFLLCSAFAGGLECAQVLFRSRFPLRSDLLIGIAGCGYGVLLHRLTAFPIFRALGDRFLDSDNVARHRLPSLWPLFLIHYPC